jgi:hypothetical protein
MPSPDKIVIKSYLTAEEYEKIQALAESYGTSVSCYVKNVCLSKKMKSTIDQKAVLDLLKVAGDLGRLGGLFKLGLNQEKFSLKEIEPLLNSILELKEELATKIKNL